MAASVSYPARDTGTLPQFRSAENTIRRQLKLLPPALQISRLFSMLCIWLLALAGSGATAWAQTFQNIPALSFTKTVNSTSNPLPQVLTVASTGTNFNFYATVINGTGGSWLTQSSNSGYSQGTPFGVTLTANPDVSLAAGTYTAQLSLTPYGGSAATLIPVSLTIEPSSANYFDELPGALTFSMTNGGTSLKLVLKPCSLQT